MVGSVVFIHESEIAHLAHILPTSCLHCWLIMLCPLPLHTEGGDLTTRVMRKKVWIVLPNGKGFKGSTV